MTSSNRRENTRRQTRSAEFIQDYLRIADDENSESDHMVDAIAHLFDPDDAPSPPQKENECIEDVEVNERDEAADEYQAPVEYEDNYETHHCYDSDRESRYPESREIYLNVLGLAKKPGPGAEVPGSGETGEHDIAEWYFKRRQAYRPMWGQQHTR